MINIKNANLFCSEDISLIENYETAAFDETQVWECHHRKETDDNMSMKQLIKMKLYYHRPASELIFLTEAEHKSLHHKGRKRPIETCTKISNALKGKVVSEETKRKLSEINTGKRYTEKTKKKLSEIHTGKRHTEKTKKKLSEIAKNRKKCVFLTPEYDLVIMQKAAAYSVHPDWIMIEEVAN